MQTTQEGGTSTLQLHADPDDPQWWAGVRSRLLAARDQRPQPARDDKVVTSWNGLAVAALADASLVLGDPSLLELARAISALTDVARAGRTTPADMSGGTITITNVGVFGVDTGTPILNPGESGIVAFGAIRRQPWVVGTGADERIEPRWVTQLAVSFDHRLVDGQQGSQFLADVAAVLSDPGLALL